MRIRLIAIIRIVERIDSVQCVLVVRIGRMIEDTKGPVRAIDFIVFETVSVGNIILTVCVR